MENIAAIKKLQTKFDELLGLAENYIPSSCCIQEMEKSLLENVLKLGLELLSYTISRKSAELSTSPPSEAVKDLTSKGLKSRKYLSLFGWIDVERNRHWSIETGSYYELDELLKLPSVTWSYNLQEWVGESSCESDFRESVKLVNKILGLNISDKSAQRNVDRLGDFVDEYYEKKPSKTEESAVCFSASFDGKGVPKITARASTDGNPKKHINRGEKKGTKQMATVSVTSAFTPKNRTKTDILRGLMEDVPHKPKSNKNASEKKVQEENDNRWNKEIHRRAFLADQAKAIEYGLDDIRSRMKNSNSRFVVPVDAGKGLENKVLSYVKAHNLEEQFDGIIIDIIHVSEYIWETSTALYGEKSPLRAEWVKMVLGDILDNNRASVLFDLKYVKDKEKVSQRVLKQINKTISYLENNGHNMNYKYFIKKGYPICSALVESTCGHLVKDRMEGSGMRWSSEGAQRMMDLRAVKINGDMEDFVQFVVKKQHQRFLNLSA